MFYREAEPEKRIIANTGWIVFQDYVMVIDANFPWGARAVLNDLRQTTDKPIRFVFNTHYHGDHSQGKQRVDGRGRHRDLLGGVHCRIEGAKPRGVGEQQGHR